MRKKVAIVQSNYIPWKGYFDLINSVDEFVLFDDMQYTRRDWRNRNKIKTSQGLQWLTIPVKVKGKYHQKICETEIEDAAWNVKHWKTVKLNYSKAKYFSRYEKFFEELFLGRNEKYLSFVNEQFIKGICEVLHIPAKISWSMDYEQADGKTERLVHICKQAEADIYLSGPSAQGYIDEQLFRSAGIELAYMDYSDYQPYSQLYPPFRHDVSIIDLLMNEGPNATDFMKSFSK